MAKENADTAPDEIREDTRATVVVSDLPPVIEDKIQEEVATQVDAQIDAQAVLDESTLLRRDEFDAAFTTITEQLDAFEIKREQQFTELAARIEGFNEHLEQLQQRLERRGTRKTDEPTERTDEPGAERNETEAEPIEKPTETEPAPTHPWFRKRSR